MNLRASLLISLSLLIFSCGGSIDVGSIGPAGDSGAPVVPGTDPVSGLSCSSIHGTATLGLRSVHGWPACAFSFRHASQDPVVTRNLFDVYYETDLFMSELSADDPGGFLVDLGDVPLTSVPAMVDPEKYPTGQWSEHNALQAQPNHTYFQRLRRTDGSSVATFRVKGLVPGDRVTIEWVHSPNPDAMVTPRACVP